MGRGGEGRGHSRLPRRASPPATWPPQKPSTFFEDEWRTPTYVQDLVAACRAAVARCAELGEASRVLNVGGPRRVNRVDMALALAQVGWAAVH